MKLEPETGEARFSSKLLEGCKMARSFRTGSSLLKNLGGANGANLIQVEV